MSHIRQLPRHRCSLCGKRAEYEVINNRSAPLGIFCKRHADQELASFNRSVKERIARGEPV